jgi:Uma2 family endonuclease
LLWGAVMAAFVIFEERVQVPLGIRSLDDFRRWALSEGFPERGRIDYISGNIEVDMSPEDLFCHGTLKVEILGVLHGRVRAKSMGHLFSDRTRVSCPEADLSAEPDIVFVSYEALASGRVRRIPGAKNEPGRYVEFEGGPDLVVEILSDASVQKDTRRLPVAYFKAGVRELWLADARGQALVFQISRRGDAGYEPVEPDADGFQRSSVFGCAFRLDRRRGPQGDWEFDLHAKEVGLKN